MLMKRMFKDSCGIFSTFASAAIAVKVYKCLWWLNIIKVTFLKKSSPLTVNNTRQPDEFVEHENIAH